jgi:hypothetical protein
MSIESTLAGWTGPSSATEQDKQARTERMIREAIDAHVPFHGYTLRVFAKGSYPNNTNVRTDSDVDVAVQCCEVVYFEEESPGAHGPSTPYTGPWTPAKLRSEVEAALRAEFPGQVDASGTVAIEVESSTARVDADVVPCFSYEYRFASGGHRDGTRVFRRTTGSFENFPQQQLDQGRAKNSRTNQRFKQAVRVLKRVENAMVGDNVHREVPSFLVECLVYNCPDRLLTPYSWSDRIRGLLVHIWDATQGDAEPGAHELWLEVNESKYLFGTHQSWTRGDARDFSKAAWNYLGFS